MLGKGSEQQRASTLATVLDGYFAKGGHHINVNVLNREMLMDAVEVSLHHTPYAADSISIQAVPDIPSSTSA